MLLSPIFENRQRRRIFKEIPTDFDFSFRNYLYINNIDISLDAYFLEAVNGIISNNTVSSKKARYFKAIHIYSSDEDEKKLPSQELEKIKKEFIDATDLIGRNNPEHNRLLYQISSELKNWGDAVYYYFLSEMYHSGDDIYGYGFGTVLEAINKNQKNIEKIFAAIDRVLSEARYLSDQFAKKCLSQLITFFNSNKKYEVVIRLAEKFSYSDILKAESVFEVAYAYNEIGNKKLAKNHYRAYIKNVGENSAVMNNLALLEEGEGNLAEAERLFQNAINLDPNDDIAKKNHKRVITKLHDEEAQKRAYQKAADLYLQESEKTRLLAAKLYSSKTDDGIVFCNESKLSNLIGVDLDEVEFRIDDFLDKKYFEKISDETVAFEGKILRANPIVESLLEEDVRKFEEKDVINVVANNLLSQNLQSQYGYGKELLENVSIIKSPELSKMLERDLYETVVSLVVKSYKSALILCGSIAEAVLLDSMTARKENALKALERILAKEGKTLRSDDAKLDRWVLDRLLDVALEMNLVSENLYHWGHGLRGFRNLVHPGVEQRQTIEVSRENAEMAWNVVKRLLNEIKAKDQS